MLDKYKAAHSAFLDHIIHGDQVLADHGFDIAEDKFFGWYFASND